MLLLKNPHKVPSGGIQFEQPEIGWKAPAPLVDSVEMLARKVRALRQQNPVLQRANLPTSLAVIVQEIHAYNYRLNPHLYVDTAKAAPVAGLQTAVRTPSGCCGGAQ
jgi:hypothetical protein